MTSLTSPSPLRHRALDLVYCTVLYCMYCTVLHSGARQEGHHRNNSSNVFSTSWVGTGKDLGQC